MTAISAVIPNRDGADLLRRILPPLLLELSSPEHEIIIVDDGSEDDSRTMLAEEFPQVRVLAQVASIGFGVACNLGIEAAKNNMILLLNSDMIVSAGSIQTLVSHFTTDDLFAVGPEYQSDKPDAPPPPEVSAPVVNQIGSPAGGGLLRRDIFLQLGGFDALYHPFYWEDLDLGWAAWRAGYKILYDSRVKFLHLENVTIKRLYTAQFVARVKARNRAFFGWKWLREPVNLAACNRRLWRHAIAGIIKRRDTAPLLGLWDAWRQRNKALAAYPSIPAVRSEAEILKAAGIDVDTLFKI